MSQNLSAILLVLSLYFSSSQAVFADQSIAATPDNQKMIRDYLQTHPIDKNAVSELKQHASDQVNELQGLSRQNIQDLVEQNTPRKVIFPSLDPGYKKILKQNTPAKNSVSHL